MHSGIELTISKTPSGSQMISVSRKGEKPVTVSLSSGLATSRSSCAKRPRMESGRKKEFDRQVAALSQWLDQTEVTQELITIEPENVQDRLTIEEQLVLIEVRYILVFENLFYVLFVCRFLHQFCMCGGGIIVNYMRLEVLEII